MAGIDPPIPARKPNFAKDDSDVTNPLTLPSITGGKGGDAVAGASGASSGGTITTGAFSVGSSGATETIKASAVPLFLIGGLVFLGATFLFKRGGKK